MDPSALSTTALAQTDRPGRRPSEGLLFHSEPEHPDKLQPPPPRRAEAETTVDPFAVATGNPRKLARVRELRRGTEQTSKM